MEFADSELDRRHPATVVTWQNASDASSRPLAFSPALRKIIYATNVIESLNYKLPKIIKNRGHFRSDDAVVKLLWLAIRDFEDKRARERAKERAKPNNERTAHPTSSRATSPKAGNRQSPPCSSPSATASSPTSHGDQLRVIHKEIDRLTRSAPPTLRRGRPPSTSAVK
jgi:hypothetical protein